MAQPTEAPKGKKRIVSSIVSWIIPALALVIAFNTEAKAWAIRGLMEVGFFQLHISADTSNAAMPEAEAAGDVVFKDGSGNAVSLAALKGKVVFINFWATWCPPCRAEMPSINTLYNKFKDSSNVVFIMVDVDGKYEQSNRFIKQNNYDFPLYVPASEIPKTFLENAIPTTVVLNKQGKIAMRHEGGADYGSAKAEKFIQSLLKK